MNIFFSFGFLFYFVNLIIFQLKGKIPTPFFFFFLKLFITLATNQPLHLSLFDFIQIF